MFWSVVFITGVVIGLLLILTVFRKKLALDDRALHKQRLAYVAVGFPCLIALIIIYFSDYGSLDIFSAQAQSNFMSLAKLPLIIIGLSTVLLGIVVNAHRTIQTSKQIEVATTKNKADLFVSHFKMCLDNLGHLDSSYPITLNETKDAIRKYGIDLGPEPKAILTFEQTKPNLLYSKFYPQNNILSGAVVLEPKNILTDLESEIISLMEAIVKKDKLKEFGEILYSRLDNAKDMLLTLDDLDYSDYISLTMRARLNNEEVTLIIDAACSMFIQRCSVTIDHLFEHYQISVNISYGSKNESVSLNSLLTKGYYGYDLDSAIVPELITHCLSHLVDLQYSMGAIEEDHRIRLIIRMFQSCVAEATRRRNKTSRR